MIEFKMEHLFSYTATISQPLIIGATVDGLRANFEVTGGDVSGPKLTGRILPIGGDWLLMRPDGVAEIGVRLTIESDDGAFINMSYNGLADLGEDGFQQFASGQSPAAGTPLRTSPQFQVGHESFKWLDRVSCVGIGEAFVDFAGESRIVFDIYAVT